VKGVLVALVEFPDSAPVGIYEVPRNVDCWKCTRMVKKIGWPYKEMYHARDVNCERCIRKLARLEWEDAA
jgi:hypothetical protein